MARARLHAPEPQAVTFVELFFDLVFVFAVTQVTVLTAGDLTLAGVGRSLVLFWLVWWAWTQFTWTLNPADTDHTLVRAVTLAATAAAFVMAASVPRAYADDPLWFIGPYLVVRLLGLALQVRVDLERTSPDDHAAVVRWAVGSCAALVVVLAAAFVDLPGRTWVLAGAVVADLVVAGVAGRSESWDIAAGHFSERHGLFVIIALGESLIVAGTAVAGEERTADLVAAALAALVVACLLWWTYFSWLKAGLERALEAVGPEGVGPLARDAFSFAHFALVCGIVGFAVAVEEIVHHPDEALHDEVALALGAGIALYVGASALAWWRATGEVLGARLGLLAATLAALVVTAGAAPVWPLATVAAGLLAIAVVEERHRHRRLAAADADGDEDEDRLELAT